MANIVLSLAANQALTFGNPTDTDYTINAGNSSNLTWVKTVVNGQWKSWTNGADPLFQGFTTFGKGKGFVGQVAANTQDITFTGNYIKTTELPVANGLNFLGLPYNGRGLGSVANQGYIPGVRPKDLKIRLSDGWKTWSRASAPAFNAFNTIDEKQGYIVVVDGTDKITKTKIVDKTISVSVAVDGIRENTSDVTVNNSGYVSGVGFTDPYGVSTTGISFDGKTYDDTLPPFTMFFKVGETLAKVDFASEYNGDKFYVTNSGNVYEGVFAENNSPSTPTVVSTVLAATPDIAFNYPTVTLNGVYNEVTVSVGGLTKTYEMDTAYEGQVFTFIKLNGDVATATLTAGSLTVA